MKIRIKFSKTGSMRFIGHLDVMRYFQKAFRRAGINLSMSEGYSPHQIMSFASPLGIGLTSEAEYLDALLAQDMDKSEIISRLNDKLNDEIRVEAVTIVDDSTKSSMSMLAACDYCISLKPEKAGKFDVDFINKLPEYINELKNMSEVKVMKKTKRSEKETDIKENIYIAASNRDEFEMITGLKYSDEIFDYDNYQPLLFLRLTAGSIINIKPELVIKVLCDLHDNKYDILDYQIHRLEMLADKNGIKGQINTLSTEVKCELVPFSEFI